MWGFAKAMAGRYLPGASYVLSSADGAGVSAPAMEPRLLIVDAQADQSGTIVAEGTAKGECVVKFDSLTHTLTDLCELIRAARVKHGAVHSAVLANDGPGSDGLWRLASDTTVSMGDIVGRKRTATLSRAVDAAVNAIAPAMQAIVDSLEDQENGHINILSCRPCGFSIESALLPALWRKFGVDFRSCSLSEECGASADNVAENDKESDSDDGEDLGSTFALRLASLKIARSSDAMPQGIRGHSNTTTTPWPKAAADDAVDATVAATTNPTSTTNTADTSSIRPSRTDTQCTAQREERRANRLKAEVRQAHLKPVTAAKLLSRRQHARTKVAKRAVLLGTSSKTDRKPRGARVHAKRQSTQSG